MAEESKQEEAPEITNTTYLGENLLLTKTEEELEARRQEILEKADAYSPYTDMTDEFRTDTAAGSGGFELRDPV